MNTDHTRNFIRIIMDQKDVMLLGGDGHMKKKN